MLFGVGVFRLFELCIVVGRIAGLLAGGVKACFASRWGGCCERCCWFRGLGLFLGPCFIRPWSMVWWGGWVMLSLWYYQYAVFWAGQAGCLVQCALFKQRGTVLLVFVGCLLNGAYGSSVVLSGW